jgi:hypothetical protein
MIIKFDDYKKKVDRNLIEKKLLSTGFQQDSNEYNTFSKRIEGKKYSVDVRQFYIKFYINKKLITTIEHEAKPYEFWEQLELLNFI